ncbi:cytochrome c biogenesis protein [bacterium]|nr:cytochrome c biogenesis protein [bacterium]
MDFASRISLLCFGASYAISMVAELFRFLWPHRWVRWIATGSALAGMLAQTLFLVHKGWLSQRIPISNQFESLVFVSWLMAMVYLYLILRDRRLSAGIFVLPITIGLVGMAASLSPEEAGASDAGNTVLSATHGLTLLVGTVVMVIATVVAVMYLVKLRQLRRGSVFSRVRLPALERLDRLNLAAVYLAWPLLTIGLGLGFMLHHLKISDPKVISTLIAWFILTVLAHYRYQPEHRGPRVAVLTIVAGLAVLVSFLGDPIFGTAHLRDRSTHLPAREAGEGGS